MKIIRGRYKDREAELHQFANDWMTVDVIDPDTGIKKQALVLAPTSGEFTTEEITMMESAVGIGMFWDLFEKRDVSGDGTLWRLRVRRR